MSEWHFFERATGRLVGRTFSGPESDLADNIPAGCGAVEGVTDWRAQRVHVDTDEAGAPRLTVVPSAPTVDLAQLQQQASAPVLETLQQLDLAAARPVEEIALAHALGETPPPAAVERLQSINADKTALRARLAAINTATSPEELAAVLGQT